MSDTKVDVAGRIARFWLGLPMIFRLMLEAFGIIMMLQGGFAVLNIRNSFTLAIGVAVIFGAVCWATSMVTRALKEIENNA